MDVWVILFTENDYDGVVDQLESNIDEFENANYIGYSSKEAAEKDLPRSTARYEWKIVKLTIKGEK